MGFRGYMLLAAGLVFGGALFSQALKDREPRKKVHVRAETSRFDRELNLSLGIDENATILVGDVVFHHNGAVIVCDSAIRFSDRRIECFRNVIINKDSIFIYGDRADYNGDINLARVYSPVIKIIDGDATLYTYNFTFNTLDNIGIYFGGGVLYQKDNVMESERGYYYSNRRELVAVRDVELKNEQYSMSGDSVRYNMDTKIASFFSKSFIWTQKNEILTADRGRYHTQDSIYFFYGNSYILTDFRETWADTIDFNARREDALLFGNVQINDDENSSAAFGDFGQYWGERGETMMTRRPSLINYGQQNNGDTLYMRADTIFMFVIYPSDRPVKTGAAVDPHAHLKWVDALPDSVRLFMADSLRPVISGLRREADVLRRSADSIMDALYPPKVINMRKAAAEGFTSPPDILPSDPAPPPDAVPIPDTLAPPASQPGTLTEQNAEPEHDRRSRRRARGPNPDLFYPDAALFSMMPGDTIPAIAGSDSLAAVAMIPPTATDSLTAMEKVMELLPDSLAGSDAPSLLEMLDGTIPEGMTRLASDSIDVRALRSVIESSMNSSAPDVKPVSDPAPGVEPVPESAFRIPSEVLALRKRAEALISEADSLQTAEKYIRPRPKPVAPEAPVVKKEAELSVTDSVALADSIAHMDKKALRQYQKAEKKKLKVAQKAEKRRLHEEKLAAKKAERAAKEAERRAKLIARGRLAPDRADSLALIDSLAVMDSLAAPGADTLAVAQPAEPRSEPDTTERIVRGWRDVRIWRSDIQAVCDSIAGFSRDSTIRLYINPILWHGDSQIVSDSMILFTRGEAVERGEFHGNPIMSSQLATGQFNQVTGRAMTAWFRDNEIYRHDVFGNAEALYYIQDGNPEDEDFDPTPVAFIVATSSNMTFLMEDRFVRYIIARENVEWPVYPVDQIPGSQPTELKGFRWYSDRRPELKDVFDRRIRPTERAFHEALEQPKFPIAARINRRREYLIENRMWADRVDPLPAHAVEFLLSLPNE